MYLLSKALRAGSSRLLSSGIHKGLGGGVSLVFLGQSENSEELSFQSLNESLCEAKVQKL